MAPETAAVKVTLWPWAIDVAELVSTVAVCTVVTVTTTVFDVAPASLPLAAYVTSMEFAPTGKAVVLNVATPLAFSVPVPSVAAPFKKVTVPAGVLPFGEVTATVSVSFCPARIEVEEALNVAVVWSA